jgi:hypothetical protein
MISSDWSGPPLYVPSKRQKSLRDFRDFRWLLRACGRHQATGRLSSSWRNILTLQIESGFHKRHHKAVTNFRQTLPDPLSDLAQQIVKLLF